MGEKAHSSLFASLRAMLQTNAVMADTRPESPPPSTGQSPYCDQCGARLVLPTASFFAASQCKREGCRKTIYRIPDATGLGVEKGDKFGFTPGAIRLSFDPASGGQMTEYGARMLLTTLIFAGSARGTTTLVETLDYYERATDEFLNSSPFLEGLDINSASHADEIWSRIKDDNLSREFVALMCGQFCLSTKEKLAEGDTDGAARDAHLATLFFVACTLREKHLSDTIWQGHQAQVFFHRVKVAGAQSPVEARAVEELHRQIKNLSDLVIRTWLNDDAPVAPRLNVPNLREATVRAVLQAELDDRSQRAVDLRKTAEGQRFWVEFAVKHSVTIVVAILGVLSTVLAATMK
jgi:hypothetical protein